MEIECEDKIAGIKHQVFGVEKEMVVVVVDKDVDAMKLKQYSSESPYID